MGTCFRNSLSEDTIDRYNYTWTVLTFLFLAFISLLFAPLIPVLNGENRETTTSTTKNMPRRVKATCWCPAQFEQSQVNYANSVCSASAARGLQGFKNEGILLPMSNDVPFHKLPFFDHVDMNSSETSKLDTKDEEKQRKKAEFRLNELINFRTPLVLFLFALFLKLPQLVRISLRESLPGCLNLDRSLESCIACQSLDPLGQERLKEDTILAVSMTLKSSGSKASCAYLFMKLFALFVVCGEAIFVSQCVLVDIHGLESQFKNATVDGATWQETRETNTGTTANKFTKRPYNITYPDSIFHCFFKIRAMHNVHDYTVQCLVNIEEETSQTFHITPEGKSTNFPNILLLYKALFTVVLACLALLILFNFINTITWFLKLSVTSHTTSMGLPSNAPMDMTLLVHMAWINAGPVVARSLAINADYSTERRGTQDDEHVMKELKE